MIFLINGLIFLRIQFDFRPVSFSLRIRGIIELNRRDFFRKCGKVFIFESTICQKYSYNNSKTRIFHLKVDCREDPSLLAAFKCIYI